MVTANVPLPPCAVPIVSESPVKDCQHFKENVTSAFITCESSRRLKPHTPSESVQHRHRIDKILCNALLTISPSKRVESDNA
jgi:hypothetical protein